MSQRRFQQYLAIITIAFAAVGNQVYAQSNSLPKKVHRLALVIGNSEYRASPWGRLNSPAKDADDITVILRAATYDVSPHKNVNAEALSDAIGVFTRKLRRLQLDIEDRRAQNSESIVVFVFYSGHGFSSSYSPYFAGLDSSGQYIDDVLQRSVNASELMEHLRNTARGVDILSIVFIDACRQKVNLPPRSTTKPKGSNFSKGAFDGLLGSGTLVVFGSGDGKPSFDGPTKNDNSIFTQAIVATAKEADSRPMLLVDFANGVKRKTIELSKQHSLKPTQVPEIRDNIEFVDASFSTKSEGVALAKVVASKGSTTAAGRIGWIWLGDVTQNRENQWSRLNVSGRDPASAALSEVLASKELSINSSLIVREQFPGGCPTYPECAKNLGGLPAGALIMPTGAQDKKRGQVWIQVRFDERLLFNAIPSNPRSRRKF